MTDAKPDAGNGTGDGGNAKAPGTPTGAGPNAGDESNLQKRLENAEALAKSQQEAVAKARAAEDAARAEVERMKRAATPAPGTQADPKRSKLAETADYANGRVIDPNTGLPLGEDPVAGAVLELYNEQQALVGALVEERQLNRIKDDALRDQVAQHLTTARQQGRQIDVTAATAEVKARRADEQEKEIAELQAALRTAQAPHGNVPPTHHRGVPASAMRADTFETVEDFRESLAGLSTLQRMAEQEKLAKGEVKIKRGL